MNATSMKKHTKQTVLSGLVAAMFSFSASAALDIQTYTPASTLPIPQGGSSLTPAPELTFNSAGSVITSIEMFLTFNDSSSLTGNSSSGIQGLLDLGIGSSSPYVSFSPVATSRSGAERIYDVTFSSFNGDNPNNTWVLDLYDNSGSGMENGLVSWQLDVSSVPEPVNEALGVFGLLFAVVIVARRRAKKLAANRPVRG